MQQYIGKTVLITTNNWFIAPDGVQYKAIFGVLHAINATQGTLGFTPSRNHTNWFAEVGNMTIAGCQILYCFRCEESELVKGEVDEYKIVEKQVTYYRRPTMIYVTQNKEQ